MIEKERERDDREERKTREGERRRVSPLTVRSSLVQSNVQYQKLSVKEQEGKI